jgi:hypothetical protein
VKMSGHGRPKMRIPLRIGLRAVFVTNDVRLFDHLAANGARRGDAAVAATVALVIVERSESRVRLWDRCRYLGGLLIENTARTRRWRRSQVCVRQVAPATASPALLPRRLLVALTLHNLLVALLLAKSVLTGFRVFDGGCNFRIGQTARRPPRTSTALETMRRKNAQGNSKTAGLDARLSSGTLNTLFKTHIRVRRQSPEGMVVIATMHLGLAGCFGGRLRPRTKALCAEVV